MLINYEFSFYIFTIYDIIVCVNVNKKKKMTIESCNHIYHKIIHTSMIYFNLNKTREIISNDDYNYISKQLKPKIIIFMKLLHKYI